MSKSGELEEIKISSELFNKKYNRAGKLILYPFLILLILLIVFLFLGKKEIVVNGSGKIVSQDMGVDIQPFVSTAIVESSVKNSSKINKGDLIAVFDSSEIEKKIASHKKIMIGLEQKKEYGELLKKSIKLQEDILPDDRYGFKSRYEEYILEQSKLLNQSNFVTSSLSMNAKKKINFDSQLNNKQNLIKDYQLIIDETDILNQNRLTTDTTKIEYYYYLSKVADIKKLSLENSKAEIEKLRIDYIREIQQKVIALEEEKNTLEQNILALMDNKLAMTSDIKEHELSIEVLRKQILSEVAITEDTAAKEYEEQQINVNLLTEELRRYKIQAPKSGIIQLLSPLTIGASIPAGKTIARIIPNNKRNIYIQGFITNDKILKVKTGTAVRFSLDRDIKMVYTGTLKKVNKEPTETKEGSYYLLESSIDQKKGIELPIGVVGNLSIITEKTTYLDYFINKFFTKK